MHNASDILRTSHDEHEAAFWSKKAWFGVWRSVMREQVHQVLTQPANHFSEEKN